MSTMKQPADKGTERKKLKLNKETVKDLTVKDGVGQALKGGLRKATLHASCTGCGG